MFDPYVRDKESAIKGLRACEKANCNDCPYEDIGCSPVLAYDVLTLLEERSAVPVKFMVGEGYTNWFECTACHTAVSPGDKFCKRCGHELIMPKEKSDET